jgi:hypothetical protein
VIAEFAGHDQNPLTAKWVAIMVETLVFFFHFLGRRATGELGQASGSSFMGSVVRRVVNLTGEVDVQAGAGLQRELMKNLLLPQDHYASCSEPFTVGGVGWTRTLAGVYGQRVASILGEDTMSMTAVLVWPLVSPLLLAAEWTMLSVLRETPGGVSGTA